MLFPEARDRSRISLFIFAFWQLIAFGAALRAQDMVINPALSGHAGGSLVVGLRAEPKTLNPVIAVDYPSREVLRMMNADLIHINAATQKTEPALARSWQVKGGGRRYILKLRTGLRFSDGQPLTVDDVVFTYRMILDPAAHSPNRDLLIVGGEPLQVRKLDQATVEFDLKEPYAAAERLFDSIAIVPQRLLEKAYREGKLRQEWGLSSAPTQVAGVGPFRLKQYVPGERLVLERNPYYWERDSHGTQLPYLQQITFLFIPAEDTRVLRFQSGDTDIITRLSAQDYDELASRESSHGFHVFDIGPSLEYNFLFFNLNSVTVPAAVARRQAWFRQVQFRQAVSSAIDRQAIVRLVYQGRGHAIQTNVSPGNKLWYDPAMAARPRSIERARQLLRAAGFTWGDGGALKDAHGEPVKFTIVTNASNAQRIKIATMIQQDLSGLGMNVQVVPLEFRALLDRVLHTYDYDACILGLGGGDADPNSEMNVWLSNGSMHLWNLSESKPAAPWQAESDQWMNKQLTALRYAQRKRLYDRVQTLIAQHLPRICLGSPAGLVGARAALGNFQPAILPPHALWNADELFWRQTSNEGKH